MIRFGTGGWRAVIGEDFTQENVRKVAAGILRMLQQDGKTGKPVIIGYDRRFLSESAAKWVAEVLAAGNVRVWFLHRSAPTPLIMHTVKDEKLFCGIEVTASHNPAAYDGIKLIVEEGRDAPLETTARLEKLIDAAEPVTMPFEEAVEKGIIEYLANPFNKFLDDIIGLLDMKALRNRGLRVLFDSMHGSSIYPMQVIFHTARCTIDMINENKDAYFGGLMPAPTETSLRILRDGVIRGGYDMGIAMDGDGDRLGIIDTTGRYIDANEILCMLYWYLVKYKGWKGPVVRNLATTHRLDAIARDCGYECLEVPVGFKHISAGMAKSGAILGGESSGGLTVTGHIRGKDGVYAASLLVEMVAVTGKKLSQLMETIRTEYGVCHMEENSYTFEASRKDGLVQRIYHDHELPELPFAIDRVSYLDGCKVYFENGGWVVIRFSGTEPLLRIFCEMPTRGEAVTVCETVKAYFEI